MSRPANNKRDGRNWDGCNWRRDRFIQVRPIITIVGLTIPALFSGALIVEQVFNYEGVGYETVYSTQNNDFPTVLGITLLITFFTIIGNLLADIGLGIVNPRIRVEGR